MRENGWSRIKIDGHEVSGRDGRSGPHATVEAYRGMFATADVPDPDPAESVTR